MKKFVDFGTRVAVITYNVVVDFGENEAKYSRFRSLGSFERDPDEQKEYEEMKPIKGRIKPRMDNIEIICTHGNANPNDKRIHGHEWKQINEAWMGVEKEYEGKETTFYESFIDE